MSTRPRGAGFDALLDRTVVASYSRLGYSLRSRGWRHSPLPRLDGRVVVLTGATSGIGMAAAEGLARLGARLWLVARDRQRGERAVSQISKRTANRDIHLAICDLGSLASVRRLAAELGEATPAVAALVNNAGVLVRERAISSDWIELTLATNVVGPFLLTALLCPLLAQGGRVVTVSSGGMYARRLDVQDLQSARGAFSGTAAYAHTKRMQVILSELWARRLQRRAVAVHAMHPGWVDTPGLRRSLPRFYRLARPLLRTPAQGADTVVWLTAAREPATSSAGFWLDRARRPTHLVPWTRESDQARRALWRAVAQLAGAGRALAA